MSTEPSAPKKAKERGGAAGPAWVRVVRRWSRPLAACLLVATVVGYGGGLALIADLLSHFRMQYFALGLLVLGGLVVSRSFRWAGVGAIVVLLNGLAVVPGYVGGDGVVPAGQRVRVMILNAEQRNTEHALVRQLIERRAVDIAAVLEVNDAWAAALDGVLPHEVVEAREDRFGLAIYSRWPLGQSRLVPSGASGRPTLVTTVEPHGGPPMTLVATHPPPPVSSDFFEERNTQLEALARVASEPDMGPVVLVGDLNTTHHSPHFGALLAAAGLRDARDGHGALPTWPAGLPSILRIPIDHVLVSEGIDVVDVSVGPPVGSDHRPLITVLAITRPTGR